MWLKGHWKAGQENIRPKGCSWGNQQQQQNTQNSPNKISVSLNFTSDLPPLQFGKLGISPQNFCIKILKTEPACFLTLKVTHCNDIFHLSLHLYCKKSQILHSIGLSPLPPLSVWVSKPKILISFLHQPLFIP